MKYVVYYWRRNLVDLTGLEHNSEIDDAQLATLISEKKVNVMVQHVAETPDKPSTSYCYIDDLNHRFQQR